MDGYLIAVVAAAVGTIGTIGFSVFFVLRDGRRRHCEQVQLRLLEIFGAAIPRVQTMPPELVSWVQLANAARALLPHAFASLDAVSGRPFPFPAELVEGVHARWTSEWLAWEREHDSEYKRRTRDIEHQLSDAEGEALQPLRARLGEIEQEKLLRYQERYEQYVRVGKALSDVHENARRP